MSIKPPRDFSDPGTKLVEVTPEMERKERERGKVGGGIYASWGAPNTELDPSLFPPEKLKMLEETQRREQSRREEEMTKAPPPAFVRQGIRSPVEESKRYFLIPALLMVTFKKFIQTQPDISVNLTVEQAQQLLDEIGALKTPKNMADAKVIIKLSDQLEEWVAGS